MSKELTAKRDFIRNQVRPFKSLAERKKEIAAVNNKARRDRIIAKLMKGIDK